jgi:hypothetical protein
MILQHQARQHLYHGLAGSDEPAAVFAKTSVFDQVQSLCDHETGPATPTPPNSQNKVLLIHCAASSR